MSLFYLSFCDLNKPDGEQFLGGTVVEAQDSVDAVIEAHLLGINPGGQVRTMLLAEAVRMDSRFGDYFNRFVPREKILSIPHLSF